MPLHNPNVSLAGVALVASWLLGACSSDDNNDSTTSTGDVTAGKSAVAKYACTSCHGADLSGSTQVYPGSMAYAANLTPDKDTGLGDWDADTIKKAILTGVDDEGAMLCPTMPVFNTMHMTDAEATNIVAYLQSLPAVSKEVPESECASGGAAGNAGSGGSGGAGGS